jgi:hypothetical protein
MNELQTLESTIKNAPDESWDTFNNERYYKRCGDRWFVWLYHTGVWSVPICDPPVDFVNRKDIEKQIDQLKEIEQLKSRNQKLFSLTIRLVDTWWPFVHGSVFPSQTARNLLKEARGVIEGKG